jgi:hypothetical protein
MTQGCLCGGRKGSRLNCLPERYPERALTGNERVPPGIVVWRGSLFTKTHHASTGGLLGSKSIRETELSMPGYSTDGDMLRIVSSKTPCPFMISWPS